MFERGQALNALSEHLDTLTSATEAMFETLRESDIVFFSDYQALVSYLANVLTAMDAKLDELVERSIDE